MTAEALPTLPIGRTCPYAPRAEHVRLQEQEPVSKVTLPSGSAAWVVARFGDVRTVLSDARFSSDRERPGFPRTAPRTWNPPNDPSRRSPRLLIAMDAPEHGRRPARRARRVHGAPVGGAAAADPGDRRRADRRDAGRAGPGDLVDALSLPVPSLVICEMLGVPYADHEFFQEHTVKVIKQSTPPEDAGPCRSSRATWRPHRGEGAEPADDLLGRQIVKLRAGRHLPRTALVGMGFCCSSPATRRRRT